MYSYAFQTKSCQTSGSNKKRFKLWDCDKKELFKENKINQTKYFAISLERKITYCHSTQCEQTKNWFSGAIDLQAMRPIVNEFKRLWLRWKLVKFFTVIENQSQSQKKLRLSLDPSCHHVYICDHHKEMIQVTIIVLQLGLQDRP